MVRAPMVEEDAEDAVEDWESDRSRAVQCLNKKV